MGKTTISWTDYTFNPWIGCKKVSPGCKNCYAETLNNRMGWVEWGKTYHRSSEANWNKVRTWNKEIATSLHPLDTPRYVFCASLADVFDMKVPPEWRNDLWKLIRQTPNLVWQILTKRPENIHDMLPDDWDGGWSNVWLGVSAEDQENAKKRIQLLIRTPAAVRFVSCEPLLGRIDLREASAIGGDLRTGPTRYVRWVIVGGESGSGCRPMDLSWAREIKDDCKHHGVAFFMKQDAGPKPGLRGRIPDDLWIQEFPKGEVHADV